MALLQSATTSASITTNTTTTLVSVGDTTFERIYVYFVGVDVQAGGTTSQVNIQDSAASPIRVGTFLTTAIGHQESLPQVSKKDFHGLPLTVGKNLVAVTTGGAAATLTITTIYEIKGGA